jgi:bifunctional DNase/RNase
MRDARLRPLLRRFALLAACGLAAQGVAPAGPAILAAGPTAAAAAPKPAPPGAPAAGAVAVHIAGLRMMGADQVILLLADEKEERAVPIVVGRDQGLAIYLGKERTATPRPMTHDLLVQVLRTLNAVVEAITVTELRNVTYYSEIALRAGGTLHRLDARPSDAIALAVRLDTPMFAVPGLLRPVGESDEPPITAELDRRLGVSVQELDADLAEYLGAPETGGVLVAAVRDGGAGARAGLRRGDLIQSVNGRPTTTLAEYREAIGSSDPRTAFGIWRNGRALSLVARVSP